MENYNLDHLFGNLMDDVDSLVETAENIISKHHPDIFKDVYQCSNCGKRGNINNIALIITKGFFCPKCIPKKK